MQQVTPKLGAWVTASAFLVRKSSYGKDDRLHDVRLKIWERIPLDTPTPGVYVGRRMKSNGSTYYHGPEEGIEYKPVAYFEVWLVAYAENRDILVCLPQDVRLEKRDE